MCGIAGIFVIGPQEDADRLSAIDKMTLTLAHRGPDASGTFRSSRVALGHRRLSIIDLSENAAQPMFNEDRTLVLVFNGEIYNFRELRVLLEREGHVFRSNSDGEVILHLYEKYGSSCVKHLEGMFAFCIYDVRRQTIYLARDRIGEKPLFYATVGDCFYFASEIKAFFAIEGFPKRISPEGVRAYFNFIQIPAPVTIFQFVKKLRPAHWLIVDCTGATTIESYWRIDFTQKARLSTQEAVDHLHGLMVDSVSKMLISDVPIGIMLSGGVDSTLILAIAKEIGASNVLTFTVGNLEGGGTDEECRRALKVAKQFGVRNQTFDFGTPQFAELREAVASCDEPLGLLEIFYMFGVFRQIKEYAKVVLTGNGADEVFGGYVTYNATRRLSDAFRFAGPLISRNNELVNSVASRYYVHRNWKILRQYFLDHHSGRDSESARLLVKGMELARYDNLLDAKLFADLSVLGNHGVSSIPDTGGMLHSVELRSPFLHHKIIEFAASLKADLKVRDFLSPVHNKHIVKLLLSNYVDQEGVYARKYGFGFFINSFDLMRTRWQVEIRDAIFDPVILDLHLFDFDNLANIWERFLIDKLHFRERLIFARYVIFALWYKHSFLVVAA